MFEYGSLGKLVFSFVKTDLNWLLRISALSLLSDSVWGAGFSMKCGKWCEILFIEFQ